MGEPTLRVNEIFFSIQGESSWVGRPCVFVRLTGCPLRCSYCDTEYAFKEGTTRSVADVTAEALGHPAQLVEITGGEPLIQPHAPALITALCDAGRTVLVETSGVCDIRGCDPRCHRIVDIKTPGSGEADRTRWENLAALTAKDEVKFVITDRADYEWARDVIRRYDLETACGHVLLSPVFEQDEGLEIIGQTALSPRALAEWILEDGLAVRLQLQLHKFIWDPQARGV